MRKYSLYLMKENIASDYLGKEKMFYNLIREYTNSVGDHKEILQKQIDYITLPIPILKLYQQLSALTLKSKNIHYHKGMFLIENGNLSSARLKLEETYLQLEASGYYDAESIFFEILRKSAPSYLAVDVENKRYGWLRPMKERNFG